MVSMGNSYSLCMWFTVSMRDSNSLVHRCNSMVINVDAAISHRLAWNARDFIGREERVGGREGERERVS